MDFEGCTEAKDAQASYERGCAMLRVTAAVGAPLLLVASRWSPSVLCTGNTDVLAAHLGQLADYAATLDVKVGYEAISWGKYVSQWHDAWAVVKLANRRNLGLILDSYNWLAREWADPYVASGMRVDADEVVAKSVMRLLREVPGDRIFLFQIADGRKMSPPMQPPSDPDTPRLLPWSRGNVCFNFLPL